MIWSDLVLVIMQTECMDSWVMCVAWKGIWTEITVIGSDLVPRGLSLVKLAGFLANSWIEIEKERFEDENYTTINP